MQAGDGADRTGRCDGVPAREASQAAGCGGRDSQTAEDVRRQRKREESPGEVHRSDGRPAKEGLQAHLRSRRRADQMGPECQGWLTSINNVNYNSSYVF